MGKGTPGHAQEQQEVETDQAVVGAPYEAEEAMVVHPHHADVGEAGEEREVRRPESQQLRGQPAGSDLAGDLDLEDQEGDRDGEDAVAEGFDPRRLRVGVGAHSTPTAAQAAATVAGSTPDGP